MTLPVISIYFSHCMMSDILGVSVNLLHSSIHSEKWFLCNQYLFNHLKIMELEKWLI